MTTAAADRTIRILRSTRSAAPTHCRSCGSTITFARTYPKGKAIPLNGVPVARMTEDVDGDQVETINASDTHFATCPQASRWSKR